MVKYKWIGAALPLIATSVAAREARPNILLIVADDLGKGDISTYGSHTIHTPNIDRLARDGVCFSNGYATSATSTPSRYAIMTGMYPWTNENAKILPGDAPLIIDVDRPTMPKMFQAAGYATAAIGKWHLGMGDGNTDWNRQITPSANAVGFDYTCLIAATNDRVPTVYVRDGLVVGLDPDDPISVSYDAPFEGELTADNHPEMLRYGLHHGHNNTIVNGISRIGHMKGGKAALWRDEDMAAFFLNEVRTWLDTHSDGPFFLYYGLHQPHVPRVPNERFAGESGYGVRGDVILEADWCVGELLGYLEDKGLMENTLIVFTSDNGPVVQDGYLDGSDDLLGDHDPALGMRGGKYSLFDAGTHIPLMAYWKGHTRHGVVDAFFSQLDFYASFAALAGGEVPEGLDSQDHHALLLGKRDCKARRSLILEAKSRLCYREGDYVIIPPYKGKKRDKTGTEIGNFEDYVLYDLSRDKGQKHDIKQEEPRRFERMKKTFHALVGEYYNIQPQANYKGRDSGAAQR